MQRRFNSCKDDFWETQSPPISRHQLTQETFKIKQKNIQTRRLEVSDVTQIRNNTVVWEKINIISPDSWTVLRYQTRCCFCLTERGGERGRSQGGRGYSGWLLLADIRVFFFLLWELCFFCILLVNNGRMDRGMDGLKDWWRERNEPITIHRTASEKVFQFGVWGRTTRIVETNRNTRSVLLFSSGPLNVCDEWMIC